MTTREPPIGDYGVVGDCRTAALVARDGSIDWWCLPSFGDPAVFSAILDRERGGRLAVSPVGDFAIRRRYLPGTNILETTFEASTGSLRVTDLMPVAWERVEKRSLTPARELLRCVECLGGEVEVEVFYDPRFDFARVIPKLQDAGENGLHCEHRAAVLVLRSEIPMRVCGDQPGATGRTTLRAGDRAFLSLTFNEREPVVYLPLGEYAAARIERSRRWWRGWTDRCRYGGPYGEQVRRSALALKLCTYAPSGAHVAAVTSSLPEEIGGSRNWDYRFCWLRDAVFTLNALFELGYVDEGHAFFDWLLHATRRSAPRLMVAYDLYGRRCPDERELDHLSGYRGSSPVRIGNEAARQRQLDLYGEVVAAAHTYFKSGGEIDSFDQRLLVALGDRVCSVWRESDRGIWEPRGEPRQLTYSKVMCWTALDRLLELHSSGRVDASVERITRTRDAIARDVEENGYNRELGAYVSWYGSDVVDASLLLLPLYGYRDARDDRMCRTIDLIHERLGRDGLLLRYLDDFEDGLPGREGAFKIGGFWAVEAECLRGDLLRATELFERQLEAANDLGLFSEEIDPSSGELLGNLPQALSHVGLINAALRLESTGTGERR